MPKRAPEDTDKAVPVRVEATPRRGLSRQEAARYVGISTTKFDELVGEGQMPQPFWIGSQTIWDLHKLDAAFDLLSGPEQEFDSFADWDAQLEKPSRQPRNDVRPGSLARAKPSVEYPGHPNIYTADTLAERWTCSGNQVRNLIRLGHLQAMERMGKMIRITPAAVIAFEETNVILPDC